MSDEVIHCGVCHSLIDEEDLFCANCGTEAPHVAGQDEAARPAACTMRLATHNFQCCGCGASMSYDAGAGSLRCPFCGSVELDRQRDARVLSPRRVVPFRIGREAATAAMRQWLGHGFFRPGDLARQAAIVEMTPVYVPCWVFRAQTHTYWTADTSRTPPGARSAWYPMAGEHRGGHGDLLIGASGVLAPAETAAICPFDLAEGVPPEEVDLDRVTVEQFSVPRKYARPLARRGIEQREAAEVAARYVPGRARNVRVNVRIEHMASEPVLLPVWTMAYRYEGQVYRFLLNGQTGKPTGEAPTSMRKVLGVVAAVVLGVLVMFLLALGLLR